MPLFSHPNIVSPLHQSPGETLLRFRGSPRKKCFCCPNCRSILPFYMGTQNQHRSLGIELVSSPSFWLLPNLAYLSRAARLSLLFVFINLQDSGLPHLTFSPSHSHPLPSLLRITDFLAAQRHPSPISSSWFLCHSTTGTTTTRCHLPQLTPQERLCALKLWRFITSAISRISLESSSKCLSDTLRNIYNSGSSITLGLTSKIQDSKWLFSPLKTKKNVLEKDRKWQLYMCFLYISVHHVTICRLLLDDCILSNSRSHRAKE